MNTIHKRPSRHAKWLSKTDIRKVANSLGISEKEVSDAYQKFERSEMNDDELKKLQKETWRQNINDLIAKDAFSFTSDRHRKLIENYLHTKTGSQAETIFFARMRKNIFREVHSSMEKGKEWRTTAYHLTLLNTPERNMAIRFVGKLFPKDPSISRADEGRLARTF